MLNIFTVFIFVTFYSVKKRQDNEIMNAVDNKKDCVNFYINNWFLFKVCKGDKNIVIKG